MDRPDWESPQGTTGLQWGWERLVVRPALTLLQKLLAATLLDLRWEGGEHIPPEGAVLAVCNHVSVLDPPLVAIAVHEASRRQARAVAAEDLLETWMGSFLHYYSCATIRRGRPRRSQLERILHHLESGEMLAMWPEGGISRDGHPLPFQSGLTWILARHPCPVLPTTILGSRQAWPRDRAWPEPWPVRVVFHPIVQPTPEDLEDRSSREALRERIRAIVATPLPQGIANLPKDEEPPSWPL